MIELYSSPTPNGHKASCTLEEMGIPYNVHMVNLMEGDQRKSEYIKLSTSGRIPAIVDNDNDDFAVFESGAIMLYLAEKTGMFLPADPKGRSEVIQWLMWQMGGVGPMMGQANVFYRYFPEKIQPAIDRYQNECRRLFEVADARLAQSEYLVGSEFTLADIANWCWIRTYKWSGVSVDGLDNLQRWLKVIRARPAMERGIEVPIKLPNLDKIDSEDGQKAADEFVKGARTMVQK